jgi:hypothetical protein
MKAQPVKIDVKYYPTEYRPLWFYMVRPTQVTSTWEWVDQT